MTTDVDTDEPEARSSRWVAVDDRDYPWNILGQHHGLLSGREDRIGNVDHMLTAAEVLEATGLDFFVKKYPLYLDQTFQGDPTYVRAPKHFLTGYETPTGDLITFAPVSDVYEVVQPVEALSIFDEVIKQWDGANYSSAWNLPEKCQMGVTLTIPAAIKIGPDRTALHMLGRNSFDGTTGLMGIPIATQLGCTNQIPSLLRGARRNGFSFKHTKEVKNRAAEARTLIGRTQEYFKELEAIGNRLYSRSMSDKEFEKFLGKLAPFKTPPSNATDLIKERQKAKIAECIEAWKAEHNAHITGTEWGALSVVTEYAQWGRRVQGSPRTGTTPERQRAIGTMVHPTVEGLGVAALSILEPKAFARNAH